MSKLHETSKFLNCIPLELLNLMQTETLTRHDHNFTIRLDYFQKCKSLCAFFNIIGTDDGLPQDVQGD
jgi:hypothetical protein